MKSAALQLDYYFVTELNVTANREHDPQKAVTLTDENIVVKSNFMVQNDDSLKWQVTLRVQQQGGPSTNPPYFFTIEMVGFFTVAESYPAEKAEWMVRTNASSVLYSTAREALRVAMSQGPFRPLLLPNVSFYMPDTKKLLEETKPTRRKTPRIPPAKKSIDASA